MLKKLIKLLLVILCMVTIFNFSSDNGNKSTKKSDNIIIKTITVLKGINLTKEEKKYYTNILVLPVRKSAHFIIYFILGLLVVSLTYEYQKKSLLLFLISLIICFLYACSDEIHQLLTPGRSGMILDVLLDSTASFISILIYVKIKSRKGTIYEQKKAIS